MRIELVEFQGCVEIVAVNILGIIIIVSDGPKLDMVLVIPCICNCANIVSMVEPLDDTVTE
jgi:hypothetical protein